ncbi:MAG: hypothetical protein B5M53_05940 [Candidatus Cloacimonas sp. 4484_209]|nr:MAG: hypothetical protein B5M53_05940 [Candidatus Cloacimonas sp. 4484_209]
MSYRVIARKYRPKNFSEIVGQEHITKTLVNAITNNRVAHAYLFSGPRGVGKTTTARVLAKSLNCEKGPTPFPCNVCQNCKEIDESINLDVLEIDGASNRGIDEVRTLQENTRYAPGRGKYKIYIIDEVHMLTKQAFNALLKTLEEPPEHVIFIFATTEPYQVPMTVLSRTQRFNFRRLTVHEIEKKLRSISDEEEIDIDDTALRLIARQADGSLRDAEGMLDQMFTFSSGKISEKEVREVFGFVEEDMYFSLTNAIIPKDEKKILEIVNIIYDKGYDTEEFISGYIKHLRNIFLIKNSVEIKELSPDEREKYEKLNKNFSNFDLLQMLNRLSQLNKRMKHSTISRILLEIELLTISHIKDTQFIEDLIKKVEKMEKNTELINPLEEEIENNDIDMNKEIKNNSTNDPAKSLWNNLRDEIGKKKRSLSVTLSKCHPIEFSGDILKVQVKEMNGFFKEHLDHNGGVKYIENVLHSITGQNIRIIFVETKKQTIKENIDIQNKKPTKQGVLKKHPTVKRVQEILGAEIVEPDDT